MELSALASNSKSLAGVTLFGNYGSVTYTDDHTAEPWHIAKVAPSFFDVLAFARCSAASSRTLMMRPALSR